MIEDAYIWLFKRAADRRWPLWFWVWAWRRVFVLREIQKHLARRNLGQAVRFLRML